MKSEKKSFFWTMRMYIVLCVLYFHHFNDVQSGFEMFIRCNIFHDARVLTYAQNVLSNMLLHTIANQKYSQLFKQQENRTDFNQTAGGLI